MFTIRSLAGTYRVLSIPTLSVTFNATGPGLIFDPLDDARVLHAGYPVDDNYDSNSIGDRPCSHVNIVGDVCLGAYSDPSWPKTVVKAQDTATAWRTGYSFFTKYSGKVPYTPTSFGASGTRTHRYGSWNPYSKMWQVYRTEARCGIYPNSHRVWFCYDIYWTNFKGEQTDLTIKYGEPALYRREVFLVDPTVGGVLPCRKLSSATNPEILGSSVPAWVDSGGTIIDLPMITIDITGTTKVDAMRAAEAYKAVGKAKVYSAFHQKGNSPPWDLLAWNCVNQMQAVTINSLAFVKDLIELSSTIAALVKIAEGHFSIKKIPKTLSGLWLSGRYGLRLTLNDAKKLGKEVVRALKSFEFLKVQSTVYGSDDPLGVSPSSIRYNYKVVYRCAPDLVHQIIKNGWDLDVAPTLENVWDLLPLSFVIDWFVKVQDCCTYLDNLNYISAIRIKSVTRSAKTQSIVVDPEGYPPGISVVGYYREVLNKLDDIRMPSIFPSSGRAVNILDGISLLISFLS